MGNGQMSPAEYLAWLDQYWASPTGQREQDAYDQTQQLNRKQVLEGLKAERDRIAIARGTMEANRWYQQQQVKLAQAEHELNVRKQVQAEMEFATDATGMYEGSPTWQRQQDEAGLTGTFNGAPTWERQYQTAGLSGYLDGAPTLAREQAATNAAISGAGLAMQAKGPRNWGSYLQGAYGVANSPASSLVSSVPGGMGLAASQTTQPQTAQSVLQDYGLAGNGPWGGQPASMKVQPTQAAGGAREPGMFYASGGGGAGAAPGGGNTSLLGSYYQGASYMPTAADYGLSDAEAEQVKGYFRNPVSAGNWWITKSPQQKEFLRGYAEKVLGEDPEVFEHREANARPRQGSWAMATPG